MDTHPAEPATEIAPARLAARPEPGLGLLCKAPRPNSREECGNVVLPPRKKWCSDVCNARHHDAQHPRINPPGVERAQAGAIWRQILGLLSLPKDAPKYRPQWRTAELAYELRVGEATAARELRKMRRFILRDCECRDLDGVGTCTCPVLHMSRPHGPAKPAVYWLTGVYHAQPAEAK